MSLLPERIGALRTELVRAGLAGYLVPLTDEHLSERAAAHAQRLRWLTGFTGSTGWGVVLLSEAAIFVDGRYTDQARSEVDSEHWQLCSLPRQDVVSWLGEHAPQLSSIGYDPWLHTRRWVNDAQSALNHRRVLLVPTDDNVVDAVWADRPLPSAAKMFSHPERYSGKASATKRQEISERLVSRGLDAVVLTALDSVAWTFNLRGEDLPYIPVALAFAVCRADGTAALFVDPDKMSAAVSEHLGPTVHVYPRDAFLTHLAGFSGQRVMLDPARTVGAVYRALESSGATVIEARDPVVLAKAVKNPTEIAGHKAAQVRDGVAVTRFLYWLSIEGMKGQVTELSASAKLLEMREATGELRGLSWETIAAAGPNAARPHYSPTLNSNRGVTPGSLFLVDSGGHYRDGTTDVTRTVAVGIPTKEMRDRFTRVLRGHISLARARFPAGTRGVQLDILARQHLWAVGLDYPTGTGHGVGSYLAVHEGPQYIANTTAPTVTPIGDCQEPLVEGMIVSNEPGYYKRGEYGIRIENLMLVVRCGEEAGRLTLGFEVLTRVPIDRSLIDTQQLSSEERIWLDRYHADVAATLMPHLDHDERAWVEQATRQLDA
jgi:Xaa-Pro aminopeptidase